MAQGERVTPPISTALVDDHPIVRGGFDRWLAPPGSGITVLAATATVAELIAELDGTTVDVVMLDLNLEDGTSVTDNVIALRETGAKVLVISSSSSAAAVKEAIRAGAAGYLLKAEDATETREAVLATARGESWISQRLAWVLALDDEPDRPTLSDQELRALQLYAALPLKTVARKMGISVNTVKQYLHRVQQKYRAAGRPAGTKVELYQRALEDGHLPHPE
jgi:two-component system, NarL family, nitrate/nitrite response regulator NarL